MKHHRLATLAPVFGIVLLSGTAAHAQTPPPLPDWWTDDANDTRIIDGQATENNYAPVNLGQLKHVAEMARDHLDDALDGHGGAGAVIDALVDGFEISSPANFAPANLGQLKAVAKPFYDRLLAVGYDTRQNLIDRDYPSGWDYFFPWDPATPVEENYAPANIGQLKIVFSFDADGHDPAQAADTDQNGFPDIWEIAYFGSIGVDPYGDASGNGYPNIYQFLGSTDPTDPASKPVAHYFVDRQESVGGNFFHDIKPAVEQAELDAVDYRIIEVAPGTYSGSSNYNFVISDIKLLLISKGGPSLTKIDGIDSSVSSPSYITVESNSAIVGFKFTGLGDHGGIRFNDVDYAILANCLIGGQYDPWKEQSGIVANNSNLTIRDSSISFNANNGLIVNYGSVIVENSVFANNGTVGNSDHEYNGSGAVYLNRSSGEFLNCLFEGNTAYQGGAIYLSGNIGQDVSLKIDSSKFIGNHSVMNGGAVYIDANTDGDTYLNVSQTKFINNYSGGNGGAICFQGDSWSGFESVGFVGDSFFEENKANVGGAVYVYQVDLTMDDNLFKLNGRLGNPAYFHGGAVFAGDSMATIESSRFDENLSGKGGAVYLSGNSHFIKNTIFTNNSVYHFHGLSQGGALYYRTWDTHEESHEINVVNCTFLDNIAEQGNGMFSGGGSAGLHNSILWGLGLGNEIGGDLSDLTVSYSNVRGGFSGTGNVDIYPQLRRDGLLRSTPLNPASLCEGLSTSWSSSPMIGLGSDQAPHATVDIHGEQRGTLIDMGADQWVSSEGSAHLPDWWELRYFSEVDQDPNDDPDSDGVPNIWEYYHATHPLDADTDGDGLNDGDEICLYGLDPLKKDSHLADLDLNGDGIPDGLGLLLGIDPYGFDH